MAKRVTDEEKAEMVRLKAEGLSYRVIGRRVGCSVRTAYRVCNPKANAKAREYSAAYDRDHKPEKVAYRQTHKTERAAYHQTHKTERAAYQAAYRQTHKVETAAQNTIYRQEHKAEINALTAKRYALKRGSQIGGNAEAVKAVYARAASPDPVRCYLCGKVIPQGKRHVDHIIPLSHGGAHVSSNLAVTHARCNLSKNDKTPEEYRQYQLAMATA